jgi:hypothetical protein
MKTKTSLRGLTVVSLTTLLLLGLFAGILITENRAASFQTDVPTIEKPISEPDELAFNNPLRAVAAASPCPSPTVKSGGQCVLTSDVTLDQTLVLPSDTTLNCRGHKLSPRVAFLTQVGIFLNEVRNVSIQSCIIDGFNFGIFAINSKSPTPGPAVKSFEMTRNDIRSLFTSVSLMSVDNAEIIDNDISYTRAGGRALYIGRNSDANKVLDNRFVADLAGGLNNALRVPGLVTAGTAANPFVTQAGAVVVITEIEGPEPTLLNAVINGQLFQLTTTDSEVPNSDFSERNRFERNRIRFSAVPVDGVALSVPQGTSVIGNRIEKDGAAGIRVGAQNGNDKVFPGHCTLEPSRLCLEPEGCKISGLNTPLDRGDCTSRVTRPVFWISRDTRIEDNTIFGKFESGISTTGQRTTIIGNTIVGPLRNSATGAGIRLAGKHALETTTVRRNSVSNVAIALNLIQIFQCLQPSSFGAQISLNDFTGYSTAVLTSRTPPIPATPATPAATPDPNYNLASELSVGGRGNFWLSFREIIACRGLNPADVKKTDTFRNPLVTDTHPFGISVARTPLGLLPSPCPPVSGP